MLLRPTKNGLGRTPETLLTEWELGAALGGRDSPIQIWFMKFDRLGLGYRTSSNGDLRGITFVFRSKFDE